MQLHDLIKFQKCSLTSQQINQSRSNTQGWISLSYIRQTWPRESKRLFFKSQCPNQIQVTYDCSHSIQCCLPLWLQLQQKKKKKKKENSKLTFSFNITKLLPIRRPGQGQTPVLQLAEIFTNTYMNNLNLQHEKSLLLIFSKCMKLG